MSQAHTATYQRGTWRTRAPAQTLAWVQPKLAACGISRCADVTHLDPIGLPVYCAIRPTAAVLQVSNGKGLTPEAAQVSALMEGVEFFHAENPDPDLLQRRSIEAARNHAQVHLEPADLAGYLDPQYADPRRLIEWYPGADLLTGQPVQVPASALFFHRTPSLHRTSTNGLASGNSLTEATLHALYELIERDAAAKLLNSKNIQVHGHCRIIHVDSFDDADLAGLARRIADSESKLVLLWVPDRIAATHTFWAMLLNEKSWISGSSFNTGWGTHVDPRVAAARAITEAVQSRVTMIHGAREDAQNKPVFRPAWEVWGSKAFQFFKALQPDTAWDAWCPHALAQMPTGQDLESLLSHLLRELSDAGVNRLFRSDLSLERIGVPVVRVLAPQLALRL